jgi:hypothetical protein
MRNQSTTDYQRLVKLWDKEMYLLFNDEADYISCNALLTAEGKRVQELLTANSTGKICRKYFN